MPEECANGDHLNEGVERALPEPVVIAASMVRITSTSIRIMLAEPKEVAIEDQDR